MSTSMVKALTQIISIDQGQHLVSMSIVEKQNQSAIKYNQRLFIVVHGSFLGYISKFRMNDDPNLIKTDQAKIKIPMKNLFTLQTKEQILIVKFTVIEDGKIVPKQWVLKMGSQKLATLWKQLLEYELKIMRQHISKAKGSKKPEENTNKNTLESSRINRIKPEALSAQKDKPKQQKIQQQALNEQRPEQVLDNGKSKKKQPKTFNNPLYDSNQIDSEQQMKKKNANNNNNNNNNKTPILNIETMNLKRGESQSPAQQKPNMQKKVSQIIINLNRFEIFVITINTFTQGQTIIIPAQKNRRIQCQTIFAFSQRIKYKESQREVPKINTNHPLSKRQSRLPNHQQKQTQSKAQQQLMLAKDILQLLQEKNKKYPISQITYNHDQIQNLIKMYEKTIGDISTTDKRKDNLLNYIIQAQKAKITTQGASKGSHDNWIYRQLTQNQSDNLLAFRLKCKELVRKLYIEMCNKQFKEFKKVKDEKDLLIVQFQDIEIVIPLIGLKTSKKSNNQLLDTSSSQKVMLQFEARRELYKIINNEGQIRVSYSYLCQYGGFIFLFKVKSIVFQKQITIKDIHKDVQRLEQRSKLPLSQSLKKNFFKLKQIHYNDLRNGQTDLEFKFYIVNHIENIFPLDLLNQKESNHRQTHRMELIDHCYRDNQVLPHIDADDISLYNQQKHKEIQTIKTLNQLLNVKLKKVAHQLNNFAKIFVCPGELIEYLHENGINYRYLKYIYENISNQYVKNQIASQLVANTIKQLLMKTLQDECLQIEHNKIKSGELEEGLIQTCIDFLNCVFGDNNQSKSIWVLILSNLQSQFQMAIDRKNLNKGQLFVSTIYHCGLNIKWNLIHTKSIFEDNSFLKKIQVNSLQMKDTSYTPLEAPRQAITLKLQTICRQNFEWLVSYFQLKQTSFPPMLDMIGLKHKLRLYLSNYIDSEQLDWSNNYSHLSLYQTSRPTTINYQIDLQNLFKYLRTNHKKKYLSKFTEFTNTIDKIYGNNHPFLSKMYEMFSAYHKTRNQAQDSINFIKSSILNYSILSGDNNQIVAASYYNLAQVHRYFSRSHEAQECLKKARNIVMRLDNTNSALNAKIRLGLAFYHDTAQNYLQVLRQLQAIGDSFKQIKLLQRQKVQFYQLTYRSQKKLNKTSQNLLLCSILQKQVFQLQKIQNIQSIMAVIIENYLCNLPAQNKHSLFKLINIIPIRQSIQYYKKAYHLLLRRSNEDSLFELIKKYGENANKIMEMVVEKNLLLVWANLQKVHERESLFDFISLFEELIYFIGKDKLLNAQFA